eukprot:4909937-Ditylum_brightwellii.AAC.1
MPHPLDDLVDTPPAPYDKALWEIPSASLEKLLTALYGMLSLAQKLDLASYLNVYVDDFLLLAQGNAHVLPGMLSN